MCKKKIFVTGIGTDVGKTIVSAILVEALQADYWKPIQTGSELDKERIASLVSQTVTIHPEAYHLALPASPHTAAEAENTYIFTEKIVIPTTKNHLVIEGAGGSDGAYQLRDTVYRLDCRARSANDYRLAALLREYQPHTANHSGFAA